MVRFEILLLWPKVDFDPFKIHFTLQPIRGGVGAWCMVRKFVKWIYPRAQSSMVAHFYIFGFIFLA